MNICVYVYTCCYPNYFTTNNKKFTIQSNTIRSNCNTYIHVYKKYLHIYILSFYQILKFNLTCVQFLFFFFLNTINRTRSNLFIISHCIVLWLEFAIALPHSSTSTSTTQENSNSTDVGTSNRLNRHPRPKRTEPSRINSVSRP